MTSLGRLPRHIRADPSLGQLTHDRLDVELRRARAKFPSNHFMLAALMEEVGELAKALLQNRTLEEIESECLQVAAVALRIAEEGDASFDDLRPEDSKP